MDTKKKLQIKSFPENTRLIHFDDLSNCLDLLEPASFFN